MAGPCRDPAPLPAPNCMSTPPSATPKRWGRRTNPPPPKEATVMARTTCRLKAAATAAAAAAAVTVTGCGDGGDDRYVPTGVDGDYELACYDTQTNLYVDDDLCEDGHAVGHYAPIWYPMPYGSSHGHGYTDHYPGRRVDPHGRKKPPTGNVRVHYDGARVSVYDRGRQAGRPVKVSADAAKVSSVSRSGSSSGFRARSGGDRSWSGGGGKSSSGFSSGSRGGGRR